MVTKVFACVPANKCMQYSDRRCLVYCRFTHPGDCVLLSEASQDKGLCRTALELGRTVTALEPDAANLQDDSEHLDNLAAEVAKGGVWSRIIGGPVKTVGRNVLPAKVPCSNIPAATRSAVKAARAKSKDGGADDADFSLELAVATDTAETHGLTIQVRTCYRTKCIVFIIIISKGVRNQKLYELFVIRGARIGDSGEKRFPNQVYLFFFCY